MYSQIVKGLQSSKKRLRLIQYLKGKINKNGIVFLQETQRKKGNGRTIFKEICFIHMVRQFPVVKLTTNFPILMVEF